MRTKSKSGCNLPVVIGAALAVLVTMSPEYDDTVPRKVRDIAMRKYIYRLAQYNPANTPLECSSYADAVLRYSAMYRLPAECIARQDLRETGFDATCDGRDGEHGVAQIKMKEHAWIFKNLERYDPDVPIHEQMHWIYNGIEAQCWLMSNYYYRYRDYDAAIICYWRGEYSTNMAAWRAVKDDVRHTDYYRTIMDAEYAGRKYFGGKTWKY